MAVRIVCDSTAYLPRAMTDEYAIELVSLYVMWGDEGKPELEITDLAQFYTGLREMKDLPTTSQPSVGQFTDVFRPILEAGDDVVSIHLASAISGTHQSALQARDLLAGEGFDTERIVVIDSERACGGLGLLALAAATAARQGGDLADVQRAVRAMHVGQHFWFAVDTLEYLRRGGRIGAAQAMIGGAIKIKPILSVGSEGIVPVEKVRTQSRALDRLVELGKQNFQPGGRFAVQHIQAPELAQSVVERCRREFGGEPVFVSEVGPVIGAHAGPGLIGMAVCPDGLVA